MEKRTSDAMEDKGQVRKVKVYQSAVPPIIGWREVISMRAGGTIAWLWWKWSFAGEKK